jgi:hypothetical protein
MYHCHKIWILIFHLKSNDFYVQTECKFSGEDPDPQYHTRGGALYHPRPLVCYNLKIISGAPVKIGKVCHNILGRGA